MHAATGGIAQRIGHRAAHRIIEHQVIQQVHLKACAVDIIQQRLEGGVVIVQQINRIAWHRHEITQAFAEAGDVVGDGIAVWRPAQVGQWQLAFCNHPRGIGLAFQASPG